MAYTPHPSKPIIKPGDSVKLKDKYIASKGTFHKGSILTCAFVDNIPGEQLVHLVDNDSNELLIINQSNSSHFVDIIQ